MDVDVRRIARRLFARLFLRDRWVIGVIHTSIETVMRTGTLPAPRWLPAPAFGHFHADPFPVSKDGRDYVLFEDWSMFNGRGWIAVRPLDAEVGPGPPGGMTAIDTGHHASYPGLFRFEGEIYCTPEMWEAGGLRIFRMGHSPSQWIQAAAVLDELPLVDPTVFEHEGRWWLFATIRGRRPDADLYGWFADTPFGPWTAHQLNPLKSAIRSARPAGAMFRIGDALYRPAQDCSAGYGVAIGINRIVRLDPGGFEEVEVIRLTPGSDWPYRDGMHTLNTCGGRIIIDAKHQIFDPLTPVWTLLPHVRRLWRRARPRAVKQR